MKAQDKKLWSDFVVYLHQHNGEVLEPIRPLGVWLNPEVVGALRNRLDRLLKLERELEKYTELQGSLSDQVDAELQTSFTSIKSNPQYSPDQLATKSEDLSARLNKFRSAPNMEKLRNQRAELPLNQYQTAVKDLVDDNKVCVIVGATGSGKTTQLPQLILDQAIDQGLGAECNIICTQPRRIAAMSVAKRVAVERGEELGQSVGYKVRFSNSPPQWGGSITYCTTGMLLRVLDNDWTALKGISHVIVDEVHERDIQIDFLLVLLRRLVEARRRGEDVPNCKIILMSATIDATMFRRYFGAGYDEGQCPLIEIPGRMFPVKPYYLDDILTVLDKYPSAKEGLVKDIVTKKYLDKERIARRDAVAALAAEEEEEAEQTGIDWSKTGSAWEEEDIEMKGEENDQPDVLLANIIAHLCQNQGEGAILVFLPGIKEITALYNMMQSVDILGVNFRDPALYQLYMLHSSIPTMQQEVFNPTPPGVRKIILSTNIAETSVTIPEVVYVVDTCKVRVSRYSQLRRSTALVNSWISQSSARQRAGRAGRVRPGEYYALVYPERHAALPMGDMAEIKRSDLQEVCLSVRSFGIMDPIGEVLQECIEPPSSLAVATALQALKTLGALDPDETVTALGCILSELYDS
jgi:ATP-dependent RNA helicase DHX36